MLAIIRKRTFLDTAGFDECEMRAIEQYHRLRRKRYGKAIGHTALLYFKKVRFLT